MFEFIKYVPDPQATDALAAQLAPHLMPGDVIALTGHLGAGKSHFARGIIQALGCQQEHLPSPTFTLLQTYDDTRIPVAHADFYRLSGPAEADDLVLDPFIAHGLCLIEWPDNAPQVCPQHALWVHIEDEDKGRKFTFKSEEKTWESRLGFFMPELQRPTTEKGRACFIEEQTGCRGQVITAVSADASFRSYWRVKTKEGPQILMDAPPPMESVAQFMAVATYLEHIGIRAPHVFKADPKKGYALIEDFGNTTFATAIKEGANMLTLYEKAIDVLLHIAKHPPADVPRQTREGWQDYLCLFTDWHMPIVNQKATHTADRRQFREIISTLYDVIAKAPDTTMLGDYHCENLMLLGGVNSVLQTNKTGPHPLDDVGVLDFQDALIGPHTYDLARFIYDVRLEQPAHIRALLTERFLAQWIGTDQEHPIRDSLQVACLFHMLRLLGVFYRLAYRDGKTQYLDYIPQIWKDFDILLETTPQAADLKSFINKNTPATRGVAV